MPPEISDLVPFGGQFGLRGPLYRLALDEGQNDKAATTSKASNNDVTLFSFSRFALFNTFLTLTYLSLLLCLSVQIHALSKPAPLTPAGLINRDYNGQLQLPRGPFDRKRSHSICALVRCSVLASHLCDQTPRYRRALYHSLFTLDYRSLLRCL